MNPRFDYESHKVRLQNRTVLRENTQIASILIVEDDDAHSYLLRFILEREGHTVSRACDGIRGLVQAQAEHPDLILMDMRLPLIPGWEVARKLKAMPEMQLTPIFGISATPDLQCKAREAGCEEFLLKPFSLGRLNNLVQKHRQQGSQFGAH